MKHLVVLTGAGMSAESGLKTFRDENGLWEGHDVMKVASPQGFDSNPNLVLEFYNQRRRQLKTVQPNAAHKTLAKLENNFKVSIITQNVDDLHERAGSSNVTHLHGELFKARNIVDETSVVHWEDDIVLGTTDKNGIQLRPHIVWFGEDVPLFEKAISICQTADILLIIGTSLQVYPAASLMHYTAQNISKFYIDPKPSIASKENLTVIGKTATEGIKDFINEIR
ncbi:Sir2 family NAD-dependent protein deacetylase [Mesoflavibacter sp. SCSIO 43206]|uniref:SIR2 family NAD-dependent protein deacylase n=1 Tax=Mesoflavibacter sp. SCSIO 43206 TaxID=2779362 RepID=UPI001CA8D6E6|nr:Sir2 family NAD-dependent protein deacetylase [Mesoflavibacter sp. SCSIO 43206]UAB75476.1 NAD-dependent deacylase [Mesoflavibacter sp. SCSIO 43206]